MKNICNLICFYVNQLQRKSTSGTISVCRGKGRRGKPVAQKEKSVGGIIKYSFFYSGLP
jgi:hypothetical protein